MNRDRILIVTAYDHRRYYAEMAGVLGRKVKNFGYHFREVRIEDLEGKNLVKRNKASILLDAFKDFEYDYVIWMDADSIMVQDIDEVFEDKNYHIAMPIKNQQERPSKKYGSYLYSGLLIVRNCEPAKKILRKWYTACQQGVLKSDQKKLHDVFGDDLNNNIFRKIGQVINMPNAGIKLFCLCSNEYAHVECISYMRTWKQNVKILHFKGRKTLQLQWPLYKEKFLC